MIQDAFHVEPLLSMTRRLTLDDSYRPDDDIKLFLQSEFDEIKKNHPLRNLLPPEWPSDSEIVCLVQKSSGQFIYTSTVMKYLVSPYHWPTDRLDIIFGLSNPGINTPFAELDALYIHISTVKNIKSAFEIVGFLLLRPDNYMRTETGSQLVTPQLIAPAPRLLEDLFFLRHGDIYIVLSDLDSIMHIPAPDTNSTSSMIHIFHVSLGDFLLDKSRSATFYIEAGNAHANFTQYFLKHLSKTDLSMSKGHI